MGERIFDGSSEPFAGCIIHYCIDSRRQIVFIRSFIEYPVDQGHGRCRIDHDEFVMSGEDESTSNTRRPLAGQILKDALDPGCMGIDDELFEIYPDKRCTHADSRRRLRSRRSSSWRAYSRGDIASRYSTLLVSRREALG